MLRIGKEARRNRVRFWDDHEYSIRLSQYRGEPEAGLWFRSSGCSYDRQGGCLMCDYSNSSYSDGQDMVRCVEEGLKQISLPCRHLLVSPSGSMLDDEEVPPEALKGILDILRQSPHKSFSFETRAETVSNKKIILCRTYLADRIERIFIGLECADDWILKYCINKQMAVDDFAEAVKILRKHKIKSAANILISIPFMTEKEGIEAAVRSVKWAVSQGVEECFLFAVHVKNDTPLSVLYHSRLFRPPSLWSLVEVLRRLGREYYPYLRLSWYTSYGAYNVQASPTTCPRCYQEVIQYLNVFAEYQLPSAVENLLGIDCECKTEWNNLIREDSGSLPLPERVKAGYQVFADRFLEPDIKQKCLEEMINEMNKEYN